MVLLHKAAFKDPCKDILPHSKICIWKIDDSGDRWNIICVPQGILMDEPQHMDPSQGSDLMVQHMERRLQDHLQRGRGREMFWFL